MNLGIANYFSGLLILLSCTSGLAAENYAIDWFTVDGGGGTGTGFVYTMSGTIGQPDGSGPIVGGGFSLTGGFWSFLTPIPISDPPMLTITLTSTNAVLVSWPAPSAGFILQQNGDFTTSNWTVFLEPVNDDGASRFIVVNQPIGNRFYRLFHP